MHRFTTAYGDGAVWPTILDAVLSIVISILLGLATCTLSVGTLGLLSIPGFLVTTPFIHFVLAAATIGGRRGATPGMRAMGLQATAWTGEHGSASRHPAGRPLFFTGHGTDHRFPAAAVLAVRRTGTLPATDHLAGILVFKAGRPGPIPASEPATCGLKPPAVLRSDWRNGPVLP